MLKRWYRHFRAAIFGAVHHDWTTAAPLPLMLRGDKPVPTPAKLRRCSCGLLHDHPTRPECYDCSERRPRARVTSMTRRSRTA